MISKFTELSVESYIHFQLSLLSLVAVYIQSGKFEQLYSLSPYC